MHPPASLLVIVTGSSSRSRRALVEARGTLLVESRRARASLRLSRTSDSVPLSGSARGRVTPETSGNERSHTGSWTTTGTTSQPAASASASWTGSAVAGSRRGRRRRFPTEPSVPPGRGERTPGRGCPAGRPERLSRAVARLRAGGCGLGERASRSPVRAGRCEPDEGVRRRPARDDHPPCGAHRGCLSSQGSQRREERHRGAAVDDDDDPDRILREVVPDDELVGAACRRQPCRCGPVDEPDRIATPVRAGARDLAPDPRRRLGLPATSSAPPLCDGMSGKTRSPLRVMVLGSARRRRLPDAGRARGSARAGPPARPPARRSVRRRVRGADGARAPGRRAARRRGLDMIASAEQRHGPGAAFERQRAANR